MVPIDRVGGNLLAPRWNTPEELELDEVPREGSALRAAPWDWQWLPAMPSLGRGTLGGNPPPQEFFENSRRAYRDFPGGVWLESHGIGISGDISAALRAS